MTQINNAYKLCIGLFSRNTTGTAFSILPEEYGLLTWNTTSIIPKEYDFTNFQVGDTTVETVERNTITALTKARKYDSGAITPPTMTFANMAPADAGSVVATLDALTGVDDPFSVLFCAGVFKSESASAKTRTYDVFNAAAAILTTDGGRTGEAKQLFTGSLALQSCHIPVVGVAKIGATMVWNYESGEVTLNIGTSSQT